MINISFEQARDCIKSNLIAGLDYDESCQFGAIVGDDIAELTDNAQRACENFFNDCENGMNKFESFVRNF